MSKSWWFIVVAGLCASGCSDARSASSTPAVEPIHPAAVTPVAVPPPIAIAPSPEPAIAPPTEPAPEVAPATPADPSRATRAPALAAATPTYARSPLRTCVDSANYNECVIQQLADGRASSPVEQRALVFAYRNTERLPEMQDAMRDFIRRYPNNPATDSFREALGSSRGI